MNTALQTGWSFITSTLVLAWIIAGASRLAGVRSRSRKALGVYLAAAAVVCWLPVAGLPLFRWGAGFVDHWSVPLVALLAADLLATTVGIECFRREDWRAGWAFGAVGGLVLYPAALGVGPLDPYSLGWMFGPLFAIMAVLTAGLLWRGNRFGIVLVAACAAWHLNLITSRNLWDFLMDPVYSLAGAIGLGILSVRKSSPIQHHPTGR